MSEAAAAHGHNSHHRSWPLPDGEYVARCREVAPAQHLAVWLLWKLINGRKVPFYANGALRGRKPDDREARLSLDSPEDRAQLVTFDAAAAAYARGGYDGLGIALGPVPGTDIHLAGIDLDHIALDDERVRHIVEAAHSYAEISPGGDGVHILGEGPTGLLSKADGNGAEIYDCERYFTFTARQISTGRQLANLAPVADLTRKLFAAEGGDEAAHGSDRSDPVLAALQRQGLYLRDEGSGKHYVRCPWASSHTSPDAERDAAYFDASWTDRDKRGPGFKCQHSHCANRKLSDLRDFLGLKRDAAAPTELLAFTVHDLLTPVVPPRYLIPGLIPCDAYSVCAGALSSGKTTCGLSLAIWRATGVDVLGLDPAGKLDVVPGPVTFITYEDADSIIVGRFKLVVQAAHARILKEGGADAAAGFLRRLAKHFRRIHYTGQPGAQLIVRDHYGQPCRNEAQIGELVAQLRAFAASEHLVILDPLRLAFTGKQNDDDGADLGVMTLNEIAGRMADSGVLVLSHTTKLMAVEQSDDRVAMAYGTAGSGLYSQHARSNFHMGRPKANDIAQHAPKFLTPEEVARRQVTALTHARLSYGLEADTALFAMRGGVLVPIPADGTTEQPMETLRRQWRDVLAAMARITEQGGRASQTAIVADLETNQKWKRDPTRKVINACVGQGWLVSHGKGPASHYTVTDAGRAEITRM